MGLYLPRHYAQPASTHVLHTLRTGGGGGGGEEPPPPPPDPPPPDPPPPDPGTSLLGVGSASTSLTSHPRTPAYTSGDWYVDPRATSDGDGSFSRPFRRLEEALAEVRDGQRILVRSGTLRPTSTYYRNRAWSLGIEVFNYGTERVVIDGGSLPDERDGTSTRQRIVFFDNARREHWKGFILQNAGPEGAVVQINGSRFVTIDQFIIRDCHGGGVQRFESDDCVVKDTVVGRLYYPASQGRRQPATNVPDCFSATGDAGQPSVGGAFVRCVALHGPDDNYDLFCAFNVLIADSVSIRGGYYPDGSVAPGDGMGFKLGGSRSGSGHNTLRGSVSVDSEQHNASHNGANLGGITIEFTTSLRAGWAGLDVGSDEGLVRNSISYLSDRNPGNGSWNPPEIYAAGTSQAVSNYGSRSDGVQSANPGFADLAGFDLSLAVGSAQRNAATNGDHRGASRVALELLKRWANLDIMSV